MSRKNRGRGSGDDRSAETVLACSGGKQDEDPGHKSEHCYQCEPERKRSRSPAGERSCWSCTFMWHIIAARLKFISAIKASSRWPTGFDQTVGPLLSLCSYPKQHLLWRDVGIPPSEKSAGDLTLTASGFALWLVWSQKNALHSTRHFIAVYFAVDSLNGSFFGAWGTKHAAPQADRMDAGRILLVVKTHQT